MIHSLQAMDFKYTTEFNQLALSEFDNQPYNVIPMCHTKIVKLFYLEKEEHE